MATTNARGSEKLMAAWKTRALTEELVREIATQFEKSPAKVETADVVGGATPTGVRVRLRYDGDDGPWCGNDILFWLRWHLEHGTGGVVKPPKIIINGMPFPDLVRMELDFGQVEGEGSVRDAGGGVAAEPTGVRPVLQVHPSRFCNLACAHCYTSSGPQAREELYAGLLRPASRMPPRSATAS